MNRARLFLWQGEALYLGPLADVSLHKHPAAQVTWGLNGPFRLFSDGQWHSAEFARIGPNHPHQLDSNGGIVVLALVEKADMAAGVRFGGPVPVGPLPENLSAAQQFVRQMTGRTAPPVPDKRIAKVQTLIAAAGADQVSAVELAQAVGLSEGRFLHLFTDSTGLPLRRYVLWCRLIKSIQAAAQGPDPRRLCRRFCRFRPFQPHFSRNFRPVPVKIVQKQPEHSSFHLTPRLSLDQHRR